MSSDIVSRLRACANAIGSFKSPKGDYGLCDDAADRIEALQAELAKAREALKPFSTDADIYDGQDIDDGEKSFNDNITVGDLRRAREVYRALQQKEREA
jgi:hypothetical protein